MTKYAYERLERGEAMPGLIEVGDHLPIGLVIEDLLLLAECSRDDDWQGRVDFLPP